MKTPNTLKTIQEKAVEVRVVCANCQKETYVPTTHGTMVSIKKWVNEHKTRIGRTYCSMDFASIDFDQAIQDAFNKGVEEVLDEVEGIVGKEKEVSGCNCNQCRARDNKDVYIRNELRADIKSKLATIRKRRGI